MPHRDTGLIWVNTQVSGVQFSDAVGLVVLGKAPERAGNNSGKYVCANIWLYNLTTLDMVDFYRKFSQNRLN